MKAIAITVVAATALGLTAAPAAAQTPTRTGVLNCYAGTSGSYIVGSTRQFTCIYTPDGGRPRRYTGRQYRIGPDLGFVTSSAVSFAVIAPNARGLRPGNLAGTYGGVSAGATFVYGGRSNFMLHRSDSAFALQFLTYEQQAGFDAGAGWSGLELYRQ
jgi:hypothetical protein